jgi:peptide/nickel transport system substrate-binding protein
LRRTILATLLAGLVGFTAACGGGGTSTTTSGKTPDKNATLTYMDSAPNASLDPALAGNDSSFAQAALFAVYDRLLGFDGKGNLIPQLATKWEYASGDLSTLTLTLRTGVKFQDGTAFDANAVKANLERSQKLGADAGSTVKAGASEISSITAPDPNTVVLKLSRPDGGFVYNLGIQLGMMISPTSLDGTSGPQLKPVGAGPFKVDSFKPNDTTTTSRYDGYWDGPKNRPAKLVFKYVVDATTRLNALRSGQATVSLLTPAQLAQAKTAGLETVVNQTASRWNIYINTLNKLKDPKVRQALNYAIDRVNIAKALSFGTGQPTVQLIPDGAPGHIDGAESTYPYDAAKAKQLLADAGYPNGLTLDYILLNSPEYSQLTDVLQQQFAAIGVKLTIKQLDISQGTIFTEGKAADLMLARWGGRADPLATLNIVIGPKGTYAPGGAVTTKLSDDLTKAAGEQVTDPARADTLKAANQEAIDQAATLPVMTRANIYGYKSGCVSGLTQYLASGSNDWRDVTVGTGC